jgi:hypothetical protein
MAIWQCSIALIPDAVVNGSPNGIMIKVDADGLDTAVWWANHQPTASWADIIANEFPPCESWRDEIPMWGNEDGIQFHACVSGRTVEEIGVRIDARHPDEDGMKRMIGVVERLQCHMFFMETQAIIPPDYSKFLAHLKKSRAAAYVKNPRQCLEQLSKERSTQQDD